MSKKHSIVLWCAIAFLFPSNDNDYVPHELFLHCCCITCSYYCYYCCFDDERGVCQKEWNHFNSSFSESPHKPWWLYYQRSLCIVKTRGWCWLVWFLYLQIRLIVGSWTRRSKIIVTTAMLFHFLLPLVLVPSYTNSSLYCSFTLLIAISFAISYSTSSQTLIKEFDPTSKKRAESVSFLSENRSSIVQHQEVLFQHCIRSCLDAFRNSTLSWWKRAMCFCITMMILLLVVLATQGCWWG